MYKIKSIATVLLFSFIFPCFAQDYPATRDTMDLADNDTVVFLGDSITHQCLYTQYVEDYYYTRYPNLRLHFHNAGVGGDRAADALVRFDEDVAAFQPKYVTILLGMNDGSYTHFERSIFDTYERDMNQLLDRTAGIGATAILIGPTMFDTRVKQMQLNQPNRKDFTDVGGNYYNAVLAFYGAWLRDQAGMRGLGFVDMYNPLNQITRQQRKADPGFTMIGDCVHPGPAGQVVMATAILHDMNASGQVSMIGIHKNQGNIITDVRGGKISDSKISDDTVAFIFTADSLPWVVPTEARLGYDLTNAGHELSREMLAISYLPQGEYELKIDGQKITTVGNLQLARGIELQGIETTPQYQQAMKVAMLNKERNEKAVAPLRNQWSAMKGNRQLEKDNPEEFQKWRVDFDREVAALKKLAAEYEDQIYQINQPQPHQYELIRLH